MADVLLEVFYGALLVGALGYIGWMMLAEWLEWRRYRDGHEDVDELYTSLEDS